MDLKHKVIVITGASSGIGALMAKKAGVRGAIPVMLARSTDKLRAVAREIGENAATHQMDVTDPEQVGAVMEQIIRDYGRIDVLINNAGYGVFERLTDATMETIEDMMNVNYFGTVRCIKAVLPHMLRAGKGHIVNIASLAGKIGTAKAGGYAATKHAVLGLTNSIRQELAGTGIRVTAVNPGPIDTPFLHRADPSGTYISRIRRIVLTPDKAAEAVLRAVEREKGEVDLPFPAAVGVKLFQLFPILLSRVAGRLLDKK